MSLGPEDNSTCSNVDASSSTFNDGNVEQKFRGTQLDSEFPMPHIRRTYLKPGLKVNKNRNQLIANFYDLSLTIQKETAEHKDAYIEKLLGTKTFEDLQEQLEYNIDSMSNAQLVSLLKSALKMRIYPSTRLVKLLEHEVKFRLNTLSFNQANKLLSFYNEINMVPDQKQLLDMLSYRLRTTIQSHDFKLRDLIYALNLISTQQLSKSFLPLIEERILQTLASNVETEHDDDIVTKYLNNIREPIEYDLLCQLFINLAANRRRPPAILKAASAEFCKVSTPESKMIYDQPVADLIMSTLSALANLNYPNRTVIAKLSGDLVKKIKLEEFDSSRLCNLLRAIGNLRWRHPEMLDMFYDHYYDHSEDLKRIDHNSVITLFHITALLNFRPSKDLKEFYRACMLNGREDAIDKTSRKWLNYVWSLSALKICSEFHLKSCLCDGFLQINSDRITYADKIRLLNLIAIAIHEFRQKDLPLEALRRHCEIKTSTGPDMQKFSNKIGEALNSIVESADRIRKDTPTPYGFKVDCEILLNENLKAVTWQDEPTLEDLFRDDMEGKEPRKSTNRRVALIYVPFDETITNTMSEPVGHKNMISRILAYIGCETVFLPETVVNREKTSADLANKIRTVINSTLQDNKK